MRSAPSVAAVTVEFPPHHHAQSDVTASLADFAGPQFERFAAATGVATRQLALPLPRYRELTGFTEANDAYLEVALDLTAEALISALDEAGLAPGAVDAVVSTTVTGLAVPSMDARLLNRVGLRSDVKRIPLFGLGCVAGAAGLARVHDYLRAFPDHIAVLVAVELCSLTIQRSDTSIPNLVAASLFGDGAGVIVAAGANRAAAWTGPKLLCTRSQTYPDTEAMLGWEIGSDGFRIVLSGQIAEVVEKHVGEDIHNFLTDHSLTAEDISTWIVHAAGPKVIDAVENTLGLPVDTLRSSRNSLRDHGNLSSVSVLDILRTTLDDRPPAGSIGLMIAMGPGFSAEFVLLGW